MSVSISSRAWLVPDLTFAEKLVLLKLADLADHDGLCSVANATIAGLVGIDRRSVRRIVARLEAKGLVARLSQFGCDGLQIENLQVVSQ